MTGSRTPTAPPNEVSEIRRAILGIVKRRGAAAVQELAEELRISYEGARQQVVQMHREGWLEREVDRRAPQVGRPRSRYRLTAAGDHLFPKHYDALSVALIDALVARFGTAGLRGVLAELTEARVREWAPRLAGLSLPEKLERLRGIYLEDDPFISVEQTPGGAFRLVERNCPFLNVASRRPALCSLTVNTLSRLLGARVVREERFQAGDGCCAFRVLEERPAPGGFHLEDDPASANTPE